MTQCCRCGRRLICQCEISRQFHPHPELVISRACTELFLEGVALRSRVRAAEISTKRQIVHYLLADMTDESYPAIGRRVNRHHSTVIYSVRTVTRRMNQEAQFARTIAQLEARCRAAN